MIQKLQNETYAMFWKLDCETNKEIFNILTQVFKHEETKIFTQMNLNITNNKKNIFNEIINGIYIFIIG